jgi:Enoyl-(Acyl carrier protein) reductase/Resolvase, N terminal domain
LLRFINRSRPRKTGSNLKRLGHLRRGAEAHAVNFDGGASFYDQPSSQYSADGWRVFAACRNPDAASKLRCLAEDTGGMHNVVAMDVTDAESVRNAATQLNDVAIDVLINSAGIAGASGQKTGNVDYESWAHVFNVNTMGPLRVLATLRQKGTLCDLHPKIVGGRPGAGLQLARLDVQREACAAFILSQKHEGWTVLPTLYDDGGFSGGTMERPALKRLIADIETGQIDVVVVVYKIHGRG